MDEMWTRQYEVYEMVTECVWIGLTCSNSHVHLIAHMLVQPRTPDRTSTSHYVHITDQLRSANDLHAACTYIATVHLRQRCRL